MDEELCTTTNCQSRRADVWQYVSASRLNLWLKCPLAFRLRYIDGLKTPTSPAAHVGKMVHLGLEVFYRARQSGVVLNIESVQQAVKDHWGQSIVDEEVSFPSVAAEAECRRQTDDLLSAYVRQLPAEELLPQAVEQLCEAPLIDPLTGEDFGIRLVGIMDLVLPDHAGPIIADFKTTARASVPLAITHEIQLSCYSYLLRSTTGTCESSLQIRNLIKTKVPRVEVHPFAARSPLQLQRLFVVIRKYLDDLDSGAFVFRPNLCCGSCEFYETHCRHC